MTITGNKTALAEPQKKAMTVLYDIGAPCGLITILSRSKGAFGSKALLKETLKQLVAAGEVTFQSNGQYKVSPINKAQIKTKGDTNIKAKVKKITAKAPEPTKPEVAPEASVLPETLTESLAVLESKLKKGELSIYDLPLKIEVLQRLSLLLSEDISDVLSNIAKDLIEANTAA